MHRPVLFMLCGLPFSGKSSFAEVLASKLDIKIISIDQVKAEAGFANIDDTEISQENWNHIFTRYFDQISDALRNGNSAISDSTNTTLFMRDELRKLAIKANAEVKLIFLDTPTSLIKKRIQLNQDDSRREGINDEDFTTVLQNFEEPSTSELPLVFSQAEDAVVWIDRHLLN